MCLKKDDGGIYGGAELHKLIHIYDHMSHTWISFNCFALNEEFVQYLVILDEDTEVHHRLAHRNGDVPSVWTEVLNGRIRTFRDLNRRSHSDVY